MSDLPIIKELTVEDLLVAQAATPSQAGLLSTTDKSKLDGVQAGATANSTDAFLLDRSNHTGTQPTSSISGLGAFVSSNAPVTSVNTQTGAVVLTKSDIGLANVDNTSDANKPVSTATQTALGLKYDASNPSGYQTAAQVTSTVNSSSTTDRDRSNHTGTQLAATISNFASTVINTVLTGYTLGAVAAITAADSILQAFGKVQAQLDDIYVVLTEKSDNGHTHDLTDLNESGATPNQVATWTGTKWVPADPTGGGPANTDALPEGTTNLYSPFTESVNGLTYNVVGTNNGVSIGANLPANCKLRVGADDGDIIACLDSSSATPASAVSMHLRRSRGTVAAPTATQSGDAVSQISIRSHDGTGYFPVATITSVATENHTATNRGSNLVWATTANGSATPTNRVIITSSGNIDFNNNLLINALTPSSPGDVTNKGYVDSSITTAITNHSAAADPHPNYLTAAEGNVAYAPLSHTHTLSQITQSGATLNQIPSWNGTNWVPVTAPTPFTNLVTAVVVSTTLTTYTNIAQLTTASLAAGLYRIDFIGIAQSTAVGTGIGIRLNVGTAVVSTVMLDWNISFAANGTDHSYNYDQINLTDDQFTTGVLTANTNFMIQSFGQFRVTTAGTVLLQFRSEVAGTSVSIRPDSIMSIRRIL